MDDKFKSRFSYYNDKSVDELEKEKAEVLDDMEYLYKQLDDNNVSSEQKSEIINSDLALDRDILEYLDYLLEKGKKGKSM